MVYKLGFVITRHVNSENTNRYWIECINQIRLFYPDNFIMIVDDNSNYEFIKTPTELKLHNCLFIKSEYPGRGEMLAYYYFYKYKLFEKAMIMHDSVFLQNKQEFNEEEHVQFLWNFDEFKYADKEELEKCISYLNNSTELLELYKDPSRWTGCFGMMSVIDYNFLKLIVEKYNLFILLDHIKCRKERCYMERIIAILCCNETSNCSNLFGDITKDFLPQYTIMSYTYDQYIYNKQFTTLNDKIIKVWTGR